MSVNVKLLIAGLIVYGVLATVGLTFVATIYHMDVQDYLSHPCR